MATFTSSLSTNSTFVASTAFPSAYKAAVLADAPIFYHRLDDNPGATAIADVSGNSRPGVYPTATATTSYYQASGIPNSGGNTAARFSGSTGMVTTETAVDSKTGIGYNTTTSTGVLAMELWFKTASSASTGQLIGFGDRPVGDSTVNDKMIYVDSGGKLSFAARSSNSWVTIRSTNAVNDNQWHHVVANRTTNSAGGGTIQLFLDDVAQGGSLAYSAPGYGSYVGYWRVGGDKVTALAGVANPPTSAYFAGYLDEVAVYPGTLTQARVDAHYAATGGSAYSNAVVADSPWMYWRLDEAAPALRASDTSGNARTGAYYLGPSFIGAAGGAMLNSSNNYATRFDGTASVAYNPLYYSSAPDRFSLEVWFKTTTKFGGALINFDSGLPGNEYNIDRMIFMNTSGKLRFASSQNASEHFADSTTAYNDGQWHHAVATLDSSAVSGTTCTTGGCMKLYVDGALVGYNPTNGDEPTDGYWRFGGDPGLLAYWQADANSKVLSSYFAGYLDEVAVYSTTLTLARVQAHYNAR